ncbi:hypothetical protein EYF80_021079 [Liparis tanakae]|uniref:Uncharacterized protein n=1 Tax=Liparis tanakae TaxID=230148 RepID=A0A4Z2HSP0_9TELE|nr:hypothetical protein EYF80_021079 [Liparis tanakae]
MPAEARLRTCPSETGSVRSAFARQHPGEPELRLLLRAHQHDKDNWENAALFHKGHVSPPLHPEGKSPSVFIPYACAALTFSGTRCTDISNPEPAAKGGGGVV